MKTIEETVNYITELSTTYSEIIEMDIYDERIEDKVKLCDRILKFIMEDK